MHFIYLHGFNSAYDPESSKVQILKTLGEVSGITYDSFASYNEIKSHIITNSPTDLSDVIFVGTSLGGYWASEMARHFGVPSVIINPCHNPATMLTKYQDLVSTNYYTAETNVLRAENIQSYADKTIGANIHEHKYLPLVLLDMEDEVINSTVTCDILSNFPMQTFAGGNHRFEHLEEALGNIRVYLNHCDYVEHLDA